MKLEDALKDIDPQELMDKLTQALQSAARMTNAVKTVQAILERTFDKDTLEAICFVMQGPEAFDGIDAKDRIPKINEVCGKIDAYYKAMNGRLQ